MFFICSSYHCITAADISVMFHVIALMGTVFKPVIESHITILQDGIAEERHGKCIYHACTLLASCGNHHMLRSSLLAFLICYVFN